MGSDAVTTEPTHKGINREFYGAVFDGQTDYWRYMAAPRHRVSVILEELRRAGPKAVVDLGCGNGVLLEEVAQAVPGAKLTGIDLSEAQIALNRRRRPEIEWHAADLERQVPGDAALSGSFDAVTALEILEHVADPSAFLTRARELARPGGQLFLSTQSGPVRETEKRVGHVQHFTPQQIAQALEGAGWQVVRVWNTGYPFHDLSKWYANRNPDASMDRFGSQKYGFYEHTVCALLRAAFRLNSRRRGAQLFAVAERRE